MSKANVRAGKVLVVDDAVDSRDLMSGLIRVRFNCLVEIAASVQEARQQLANGKFDLIVCDFEMGDGTGADFLEYLIQEQIKLPFFLYTGHRELHARNFDHLNYPLVVIHKPNYNDLLKRVSEVMAWPLKSA